MNERVRQEMVAISDIEFGARFRKDYGNIKELVQSFKDHGIIQPLAVMERKDVSNGEKKYVLLAGGRRFKAATEGQLTFVPVRIYDEGLSELERRSIELIENVHRKDLDWFEKVSLTKEIHDLQIALYGKKISTSPDAPGWSQANTADLLGTDRTSVSKDILLAEAIAEIPILRECKTADDASKLLKKMKTLATHEAIAEEVRKRTANTPEERLRSQLINSFILENFLNGIRSIPDKSIDFVEVDPPYSVDLKNVKKVTDVDIKLTAYNEIEPQAYLPFLRRVLQECYRVMKDDTWLILWFGPDPWFEKIYNTVVETGFTTTRIVGIWNKERGQTMRPDMYLANSYEMFFYIKKGDAHIIKQGRSNVFDFKPVPPQYKNHPTERPIELIQEIISTFTLPNARVLVPFLGSGNTLLAANNLGMQAFGYELTREYKDSFTMRVGMGKLGNFQSYIGQEKEKNNDT